MPKEILNGAITFDTPEAMMEAMFGPLQHDAHVQRRHRYHIHVEDMKRADEGDARVRALLARRAA